ncbi:MAG: NUDIX domain-containing protein [Myxococcales bacterium]|nr:NUDIX domain-containing protein [Myxococcales bacterium]MCB9751934.1 NUDIX domain-containing protein [Myxococcales bacterium]
MTPAPASPRTVAEIDWTRWRPVDPATLLFIRRDRELLLIRKKRGLGAGKINGPGGRIEPGETPLAAAVREVEEEVGVTPTNVAKSGELRFQFVDGYSLHVHVFIADGCVGDVRETPEAVPQWTAIDQLPYDEMWADDRHWLPMLLSGQAFSGRFVFDGDRLLDYVLERA